MAPYKAIIFDYDETLRLQAETRISNDIVMLLMTLRRNKIRVILATGRPHQHCQYLLEEQLVDCIISANGSLVMTQNKRIHAITIPQPKVETFNNFCLEQQLPNTFYTESLLTNKMVNDDITIGLKQALNLKPTDLDLYSPKLKTDIFVMCAFCEKQADIKLSQSFPDMTLIRWHPKIVSVLTTTVTKVNGIKKALDYYQIEQENCIAVGDGLNDIEMLEYAGMGLSVGAQHPDLVAAADHVIDKVDRRILTLF